MLWRRSYDVPPPEIDLGSEFSQDADPRYAGAPVVRAECLKDVLNRVLPYWTSDIVPDLQTGKTILVSAHGNSIRAIVKYLDDVDDDGLPGGVERQQVRSGGVAAARAHREELLTEQRGEMVGDERRAVGRERPRCRLHRLDQDGTPFVELEDRHVQQPPGRTTRRRARR